MLGIIESAGAERVAAHVDVVFHARSAFCPKLGSAFCPKLGYMKYTNSYRRDRKEKETRKRRETVHPVPYGFQQRNLLKSLVEIYAVYRVPLHEL